MARNRRDMDEAKAREITLSTDLSKYPHEELQKADVWVKNYALAKLQLQLTQLNTRVDIKNYIALMARAHYGSMETDEFLMSLHCYPTWMEKL